MRKFREKNAGIMRNNTQISRRNTGDLKYSFLNLLAHGQLDLGERTWTDRSSERQRGKSNSLHQTFIKVKEDII